MFTGLVEARVPIRRLVPRELGLRLQVPVPGPDFDTSRGDSLSVSGCCLTVAGYADAAGAPSESGASAADLVFDLSAETLSRTWFQDARAGTPVNLERALLFGERLGGHLVSGHVDGLATLVARRDSRDGGALLEVEVEAPLERYLIEKGSITLDGVSLTVVEPAGARFRVALIPETLALTSLAMARPDQRLHVEADLIGKWVERLAVRG